MRAVIVLLTAVACGIEPSTCPQNLSIDLSNAVLHVYNGLGGGSGSISGTFTCPAGGGGSVSGTHDTTSFDLTIGFTGCIDSGTESTLTLTGMIHDTNNLSTHVEAAHADALQISGTETACTADPISATCVVDWSYTGRDANNVPTGSGSICGLKFP